MKRRGSGTVPTEMHVKDSTTTTFQVHIRETVQGGGRLFK
jgi:hypothetical protein